jgi:predicted secreted acid phosphatase
LSRTGHSHGVYCLMLALAATAVLAHTAAGPQSGPASTRAAAKVTSDCGTEVLKKYYSSGKYLRNVAQAVELGRLRLEEKLASLPAGARPAVIFDIDETVLSTWPVLLSGEFCWDPDRFAAFIDEGHAPVIEPVRQLFRLALGKNAAVFFITSRTERHRPATESNLNAAGLVGYQELIMRPDDPGVIGREYKKNARQRIVEGGFNVVMSVGDQLGDLGDLPGCFGLLIPNPFYTTE